MRLFNDMYILSNASNQICNICNRYSWKKTEPITKNCSLYDSCAALKWANFICDGIDVREDIDKCILKAFEKLIETSLVGKSPGLCRLNKQIETNFLEIDKDQIS